jgi:hypothetical protein
MPAWTSLIAAAEFSIAVRSAPISSDAARIETEFIDAGAEPLPAML